MSASIPKRLVTVVMILAVAMAVTGIVEADESHTCDVGKSVALSLSHRTNNTGHTLVNGRLMQPDGASWRLEFDVQYSTSGLEETKNKVFTFELVNSPRKRRIPPGYELRAGMGYFRAATHALNWTAARDACASEGAHLAVAHSQEEALMYSRAFDFAVPGSQFNESAWYGASDSAREDEFITVTGVPLKQAGFATFHPSKVGGFANNCIFIKKNEAQLRDGDCKALIAYICKISQ